MEHTPHAAKLTTSLENNNSRADLDRRQKESEGYIHFGSVGWYCRRERVRRTNDIPKIFKRNTISD